MTENSRPSRMRALVGGSGSEWRVREVEVPVPGPGQLLVRARAVALNNADVAQLDAARDSGAEQVAGYEFAGEVVAAGPRVSPGPATGTGARIMGSTVQAFAQYLLVDHRHVLLVPDGLDDVGAAAMPTGLLTEHGALDVAWFAPGQSVLITGATSAIGLLGVQIAAALGASPVLATTRTRDRVALLEDAGADVVVVTGEQDLTEAVLEATGGDGVDVVLDHVGGQTFADCLPATRAGGHVVSVGRLSGAHSTIDLAAVATRHLHITGVSFGGDADELADVMAAVDNEVLPLVAAGRVRPVVDETFDFATATDAANRLRSGSARGKVVLRVP